MSGKWPRFAKNGLFISLQRSLTDNYLVGNHQPPLHFPPLSSNYKLYWGDWPKSADTRNPQKKNFSDPLPHPPHPTPLSFSKALSGKSECIKSWRGESLGAVRAFQSIQYRQSLSRLCRIQFGSNCHAKFG